MSALLPLVATLAAVAAPTRPDATLDACRPASDPAGPSLTATGSVPADPALPGATLALRFELQARAPGEDGFAAVQDGTDDAWIRSAPGAAGLVWTRTVNALVVPSNYRVRLRMRWTREGRVARMTSRTTAVCRQTAPTS